MRNILFLLIMNSILVNACNGGCLELANKFFEAEKQQEIAKKLARELAKSAIKPKVKQTVRNNDDNASKK